MSASLEQLRSEHEARFIGPELLELLTRVARATAVTYPPSYTKAGVWNAESIADELHGWVEERLFGRRDLTNLLAGARSVAALRSGLTRSFGQYLTNGHERTSVTNLFARTVKMLRSDAAFEPVGTSAKASEQLWALAQDPQTGPSSTDLRTRLRAAAELSDEELNVVKYGPFSLKSSPILREPALKQFLEHLLLRLGALTPADIIEIMRRRFALVEPDSTELVEDLETTEPSPHTEAAQNLIAQSVAARTSQEDARLLAVLRNEADFAKTAEVVGTTEDAVKDAYFRMLALVTAEAVEPDETEHICGLVLETLFKQYE